MDKIVQRFEFMVVKVKLVVGMKLFKRKQAQIKEMIENSTHFMSDFLVAN